MRAPDGSADSSRASVVDALRTLNLPMDAAFDDVKRRYRSLARYQHPDKLTHATSDASRFHEISCAYSLLSDEESRAGLGASKTGSLQRSRFGAVAVTVVLFVIIGIVVVVTAVTLYQQSEYITHTLLSPVHQRRELSLRGDVGHNASTVPHIPETGGDLERLSHTSRHNEVAEQLEDQHEVPFLEKTSAGYIKHAKDG